MKNFPLISCLCVTENRMGFLTKTIACFNAQTYPNKELIIVYAGTENLENFGAGAASPIKIIQLQEASSLSLGAKRNISVGNCQGEYFCQWDDDDWYHSRRLEMQLNELLASEHEACVLRRWILYDQLLHEAYLSSERMWEGSLLCKREIFSDFLRYPDMNKSEDNDFVVRLIKRDLVHAIAMPYLYTYVYHGNNTWHSNHFQQLFTAGKKLSTESSLLMRKILDGHYDHNAASRLMERPDFLL